MVQDTTARTRTAGKRLPLPGLNPNSYIYLDSSSDSEDTYLGEDTDSEVTSPRAYLGGKTKSKAVSGEVQRRLSVISPFSSDLEDSEVAQPRRRSGKSLKNILSLRERMNFDELEEESDDEESLGIGWGCFSNTPATTPQGLTELERLRETDITIFQDMLADASEAESIMNSLLELTASRSPSGLYDDLHISPNIQSNSITQIPEEIPFNTDSIEHSDTDLAPPNPSLEDHSRNASCLEADTYSNSEVADRAKYFGQHARYSPYSHKLYIRRKGRSANYASI
ncbi:hypothetical protein K493DRAFT_302175 [Basidiobolus meristosporus CBS 931.73]|uniref:Uncharacterized protein n=1 Tax=Basidiobolus meristosporus CBS 931.73 TaxID=1314790 RepID=A0A1Y1Y8C5_9FUNG|nr:hypothetical protein K493DRAFT_302175 [Basidiobolus meristosporus CBS 931.73]|eukprot:ORX94239.1 hypothetical protein K493DRAFT_302175 [Basidiobolus meristosporus CBS 931.73]